MKNLLFINILTLILVDIIRPQGIYITGRIVNSENNEPVENASVFLENTSTGTSTDPDGKFSIKSDERIDYVTVTCLGFKTGRFLINSFVKDTLLELVPVIYKIGEVRIFGKSSYESGTIKEIGATQIRETADISKDGIKSLVLLPGVSTNNETTSRLNIRGGTADENLILIDGVEVHNPFHIKEYPMADVSILNPDMIKGIKFSEGGFPALYGGGLSSLINVEYDHRIIRKFSGRLDISMTGADVTIKGPLSSQTSYCVGFRKSFINQMMHLFSDREIIPDVTFYDIQGLLTHKFTSMHRIKLDLIYSKDKFIDPYYTDIYKRFEAGEVLDIRAKKYETIKETSISEFNYSNLLLTLISSNFISDFFKSQTMISYYQEKVCGYKNIITQGTESFSSFSNLFNYTNGDLNIYDNLLNEYFNFTNRFTFFFTNNQIFQFGAEYRKNLYHGYTSTEGQNKIITNVNQYPDTTFADISDNNMYDYTVSEPVYNLSYYFQSNTNITEELILNLGARLEYNGINEKTVFSPRFFFSYKTPFDITIKGAWGYYYQAPAYGDVKRWQKSYLKINTPKAEHFNLNIEKKFGSAYLLETDIYRKKYSNLLLSERLPDGTIDYGVKPEIGTGYAEGIDFRFKCSFRIFQLGVNYGFLTAKEKPSGSSRTYYSRFTDQIHTVSANLDIRFLENWNIYINIFWGSGYAFTPSYKIYNKEYNAYEWVKGNKNSAHYPAYARTDFKIAKGLCLFDLPVSIYLDVMNIFNRRNIYSVQYVYDINSGEPVIDTKRLLPIILSLGIMIEVKNI